MKRSIMFKKILLVVLVAVFAGCGLRSDNKDAKSRKSTQQLSQKNYKAEGMALLQQNEIADSIKSFQNAIKQDPGNITNYVLLSQVYTRLNNPKGSIDALTAALQVAPENGELYFLLAQSFLKDQNLDEAIMAGKKSVEMFVKQQNEPGLRKAIILLQAVSQQQNSL